MEWAWRVRGCREFVDILFFGEGLSWVVEWLVGLDWFGLVDVGVFDVVVDDGGVGYVWVVLCEEERELDVTFDGKVVNICQRL